MSRPEYYSNPGPRPPPGPGYSPRYTYQPANSFDRGRRAQRRAEAEHPYFEPPPTAAYDDQHTPHDQHMPPRDEPYPDQYDASPPDPRAEERRAPPTGYFDRASAPSNDPSQYPAAETAGALTPYDDEKAEAEWRRGVEEAYTYQRPPPPPTAYSARQAYEDDLIREQREREREREFERERRYYEEREREREYDRELERELERERDRERERERRRRRDEERKEKALDIKRGGRDVLGSSEGERGLAAKLAGGAGGAWIAHEVTGGNNPLGTIGGLVVGALAANVIEKQHEKRQNRKFYGERRASDDSYAKTMRRGRDGSPDEGREKDRRERARSRSFIGGLKERFRSLSRGTRKRSPSRGKTSRRRSSYDSYDDYDAFEPPRRR